MGRLVDLAGKMFGRLSVQSRDSIRNGSVVWLCLCKCGNRLPILGESLRNGNTTSCGCLVKDMLIARNQRTELFPKRRWMFKGNECIKVKYEEVPVYLAQGYIIGRPRWSNSTPMDNCRNHRARKRAAGLCFNCADPAVPGKNRCQRHFSYYQEKSRQKHLNLKKQVVMGYGGICQCPGCGVAEFEFLTIDHVHNDGAQERRLLKSKAVGASLYKRLIKEEFPKERYQLLCFNCNCAKEFYGKCPHQKALKETSWLAATA